MEEQLVGVGIDLENIARFEKMDPDTSARFLSATEALEISRLVPELRALALAKVWTVKEAVFKSVRHHNYNYRYVSLVKDKWGGPELLVETDELSGYIFKVSISHTSELVTSIVIATKQI